MSRGGGSFVHGQLRWQAGTVAAGASKTYTITTRFSRNASLGRYINSATAAGDNAQLATGRGSTAVTP
jgi:hypothetical protein